MAERDIFEYFYEWTGETIGAESYLEEDGTDERPAQYAEMFIAAAKSEGFSDKDIAVIKGNLKDMIARVMEQNTDAEVRRLADKDD